MRTFGSTRKGAFIAANEQDAMLVNHGEFIEDRQRVELRPRPSTIRLQTLEQRPVLPSNSLQIALRTSDPTRGLGMILDEIDREVIASVWLSFAAKDHLTDQVIEG
jgi:hypothetical protein